VGDYSVPKGLCSLKLIYLFENCRCFTTGKQPHLTLTFGDEVKEIQGLYDHLKKTDREEYLQGPPIFEVK